jgi:hypothetical protein
MERDYGIIVEKVIPTASYLNNNTFTNCNQSSATFPHSLFERSWNPTVDPVDHPNWDIE